MVAPVRADGMSLLAMAQRERLRARDPRPHTIVGGSTLEQGTRHADGARRKHVECNYNRLNRVAANGTGEQGTVRPQHNAQ
jgi:hypothetical protein